MLIHIVVHYHDKFEQPERFEPVTAHFWNDDRASLSRQVWADSFETQVFWIRIHSYYLLANDSVQHRSELSLVGAPVENLVGKVELNLMANPCFSQQGFCDGLWHSCLASLKEMLPNNLSSIKKYPTGRYESEGRGFESRCRQKLNLFQVLVLVGSSGIGTLSMWEMYLVCM